MNFLKRKLMKAVLEGFPPISKFEICDKLRPYLRQYDLTLGEKEILFPENSPCLQKLIQVKAVSDLYEQSIPYDRIVIISETADGLDLMLRTGHVFHFRKESRVWGIENVYEYGVPLPITIWWWGCCGSLIMWWWKVKNEFRR